MIDLAYLTNLMHGNEQLAQKFLNIFRAQAPQQMAEMKQQIEQQDWDAVSNTAHSLKSQFEYLNMKALAVKCAHIEQLADENQPEDIAAVYHNLQAEFSSMFEKEFQV